MAVSITLTYIQRSDLTWQIEERMQGTTTHLCTGDWTLSSHERQCEHFLIFFWL